MSRVPRWLTEAFRDGVDWQMAGSDYIMRRLRPGETVACWLAQYDPEERPCDHKLERFHFLGRQDVKRGLGNQLDWGFAGTEEWNNFTDLIQIAEWDSRNGGIGCEGHHRRFDSHMTPRIEVPALSLPSHVLDFVSDYGLEAEAERKFPGYGRLTIERVAA